MRTSHPIAIAISRQLGCGGSYIGRLVARRLRYRYVDREVLRQAAERLGLAEGEVLDREDRLSRLWEQILKVFTLGTPETVYVPPPLRLIHDEELFETEADILRKIAGECNCVIVGKGASHVLKGHPGLVRVFLHAPVEFRMRRLIRLYAIADPAEALARVAESDRDRERFHRSLAGGRWTDAEAYDLCLNMGTIDFIAGRELIVALADEARRLR